jgi:hypothetical protein
MVEAKELQDLYQTSFPLFFTVAVDFKQCKITTVVDGQFWDGI